MRKRWRSWKYKHLTYFFVSLLVVAVLAQFPQFHLFMHQLSKAGYWGAFIGGVLYVSTFTAAIGALLLISMTETVPIIPLCLLAGLGGLVGDMIIFRFIRSSVQSELHRLYYAFGGKFITRIFKKNKPLSWILPILGAIIIASPLPDEVGVSMLGVSQIRTVHFTIMAFSLNAMGVFGLLVLAT